MEEMRRRMDCLDLAFRICESDGDGDNEREVIVVAAKLYAFVEKGVIPFKSEDD